MTNICVIPARGGSRRIPRKNIKLFHGKPIIAYSIETAKASGLFAEVCVSTNDEEIAEVASDYGAIVLMRPSYLAEDDIGTQEVMKYAVQQAETIMSKSFDYACCLYATSPLIGHGDIKWASHILTYAPCSYVVAVASNPMRDIGAFYFGSTTAFIRGVPLYNDFTRLFVVPPDRAIDINIPDDWLRAEQMYADLYK